MAAGSFRFPTIYVDVRLSIFIYKDPVPGECTAFADPHPCVNRKLGDVSRRLRKSCDELVTQFPAQDKLTMAFAVEHSEFRHAVNQFPFLSQVHGSTDRG